MIYHSKIESNNYFPPMVGNGDIAFSVDKEGVTNFEESDFPDTKAYGGYIFRMGRRLAKLPKYSDSAALFGFGKLSFDEGSDILEWSQELCETSGIVRTFCKYADGISIDTESFLLPDKSIYVIRKVLHGVKDKEKQVTFSYDFKTHSKATEDAIISTVTSPTAHGGKVNFKLYGQQIYVGEARFISITDAEAAVSDRKITLTATATECEPITVAFLLEDSMDGEDFSERIDENEADLINRGYVEVKSAVTDDWNKYFEEGFIKTGDEKIDGVYKTALYHIRSYTTRWSIPVGIYPEAWQGKFFAFDEYYAMLALLESNQPSLARRVPEFRLRVCLPEALRLTTNGRKPETARFYWQTSELGHNIGTPGFWDEHICQMALVALGAYEYFEYTNDKNFLSECYRMIRACACFFTRNSIYKDGDRYHVGVCTDLERMGPYVKNPFLTACGIIRTLECFVSTVDILGIEDKDYRDECEFLSHKLRDSLPRNDEMYIPYSNTTQKNVSVFAGKYPFNVLRSNDTKMLAAWEDFIQNEEEYGNCYNVGKGVSSWYAAWKANAFARAHMGDRAYACVEQAVKNTGEFNELFEINQYSVRYRPWFTTAAGVVMTAISSMLVQSDGETIEILPAYPIKDCDVCFRLAVKGGAVIDVEIKKGELIRALVTMRDGSAPKKFKILYKGKEV